MAMVKGSTLTSRLLWLDLKHGEAGKAQLLAAVSPATREVLSQPLQKADWYPFPVFVELNRALARMYGKGEEDAEFLRSLSRWAADANMTTLYRLFYKLGTPKWVIDRAARLWRLHYDSGLCLTERHPGNRVDMRILDFETPDDAHCQAVAGWAGRCIELSGGKEVKVDCIQCRVRGDGECRIRVDWT